MANYKNYAENLIGNWEKDIYEPQKQVTKDIYQTNWNKLTNDYNTIKEKLARNFKLAREEYANTLNDVQNSSFNRMNNANIDLANRGLSNSGMMDLITQADTQSKGEDVDKALASLLNTNNASLSGLAEGVIDLGSGQNSLAGDLSGDIGKLTDADAANMQQYGGLLGSVGESAAGRAASRSGSGKTKDEKEDEEFYRILGIITTLNDDELSDEDKRISLVNNFDVDIDTTNKAIKGYNDNKVLDSTNNRISKLTNSVNKLTNAGNDYSRFFSGDNGSHSFLAELFNVPRALSMWQNKSLQKQKDKANSLTYSDLNEILFGKK